MPWFVATILCNITSIGEVELSSDGAKGLRLRDSRRSRVRSNRVLVLMKKEKEERSKQSIESLSETSSQKSKKILIRMGLLEQTPCFATDKHVSAMNSQRHHILRRPNLQDLRRLKFTRQLIQTKFRSLTKLQMYTRATKGKFSSMISL
jgi:hypothetical protein